MLAMLIIALIEGVYMDYYPCVNPHIIINIIIIIIIIISKRLILFSNLFIYQKGNVNRQVDSLCILHTKYCIVVLPTM